MRCCPCQCGSHGGLDGVEDQQHLNSFSTVSRLGLPGVLHLQWERDGAAPSAEEVRAAGQLPNRQRACKRRCQSKPSSPCAVICCRLTDCVIWCRAGIWPTLRTCSPTLWPGVSSPAGRSSSPPWWTQSASCTGRWVHILPSSPICWSLGWFVSGSLGNNHVGGFSVYYIVIRL